MRPGHRTPARRPFQSLPRDHGVDRWRQQTRQVHPAKVDRILSGQATQGTDRNGQKIVVPLANLVIPEWLAIREELV
jgi:hypothetical protein